MEGCPNDAKTKDDLAKAKQLAQDVRQARELLESGNGARALACIKGAAKYAPRSSKYSFRRNLFGLF